jgi:hypothetical protein
MCIMERRKRTWPVKFLISKPTKENPHGTTQMFYAHEWEAYQKSLPPEERDADFAATVSDEGYGVPSEARGTPPDEVSSAPGKARRTASGKGYAVPNKARGTSRNFSIPPDFSRHSRGCVVCAHPDCDSIEAEFIRWRSPDLIAKDFKIANRSSIYRHAHSTGLFTWRKQQLGRTLEGILECAEQIPLESADIIIRAARIYSRLDDNGKWSEPARINFVLNGPVPPNFSPGALGSIDSLHPAPSPFDRIPTKPNGGAHKPPARKKKPTATKASSAVKEAPDAEVSSIAKAASSNSRQLKNSTNSKKRKEKRNSWPQQIRHFWKSWHWKRQEAGETPALHDRPRDQATTCGRRRRRRGGGR